MSVQISEFIITLEKFHAQQRLPDGTETVKIRTLEDQASKGILPGAYKIGNKWWINLLEWMNTPEASADAQSPQENTPEINARTQGPGGSGNSPEQSRRNNRLPRAKAEEGMPNRLRFG